MPEATDILEDVAHHEYAALCLASIRYDDPHLASSVYRDGDSGAAETYGLEEFDEDVRAEFNEDVREEW